MRRDARETRSRVLVGAQMALLAVLASGARRPTAARSPSPAPARWHPGAAAAGGVLMAAGAALAGVGARHLGPALTPMPEPRGDARLRTDGVYGVVRHPIYGGLLLGAAGRTLTTGLLRHAVATAALGAVLVLKVRHEENLLLAHFDEYAAYATRTPRFLPRLASPRPVRWAPCGT